MKKRKAILLAVIMAIASGTVFCIMCQKQSEAKRKKAQAELDDKKAELDNKKDKRSKLYFTVQKEKKDSIEHFNAQSENYQLLLKNRQEKDSAQTHIATIVEQCLREYWSVNFVRFRAYIDSCFTDADRNALLQYVGNAFFTLSCEIDHNVYKSLDEILYGPYWREFVEYANTDTSHSVIKKYARIRKRAETIYPYIYPRSVFYEGGRITKSPDVPTKTDIAFSDAIVFGREKLRLTSPGPDSCMTKFNHLRNVSDIFTADLHYMIESLFNYSTEYFDLNCPLFAKRKEELNQTVLYIIALDSEIKRCENINNKEIKELEVYFKKVEIARYEQLRVEMEILQKQLKELERQ